METLFLISDTIAILCVLYFSLRNDKLPPGAPETGFFAMVGPDGKPLPPQAKAKGRRRVL